MTKNFLNNIIFNENNKSNKKIRISLNLKNIKKPDVIKINYCKFLDDFVKFKK